MLPPDHDGTIITGKRKKGKTTLFVQMLENEPRVILYDAKGEMREPKEIVAGTMPSALMLPSKGVFRAYVPANGDPWNELEYAAWIAAHLGRCVFAVDEMADALEDREPGFWLSWVTRMGRKRDIRYMYAFQRPTEVARMMTGNAADWYLHQTNEPIDLDYVRKGVSAQAKEIIRKMQVGQSVHVKDGNVIAIMESRKPDKHTR